MFFHFLNKRVVSGLNNSTGSGTPRRRGANAGFACFLLGWSMMLTFCQQRSEFDSYGAEFSDDQVLQLDESLDALRSGDSTELTVMGEIDEVCQVKGCWITLKTGGGQPVRVTFKDYGFFVPKDAAGRKVIIRGVAAMRELDEETARHYAEDAGETYEGGVNRREVSIVASGVLIERRKDS